MIIVFSIVSLLVSLFYCIKVIKLIKTQGCKSIPTDRLLSYLDKNMPLWQHCVIWSLAVIISLWLLIYDQMIFKNIF